MEPQFCGWCRIYDMYGCKSYMKCAYFCNSHCCSYDCPNIQCDIFEERYDLPCNDVGLERLSCKQCSYNDKYCTCDDCLFLGSEDCSKSL